MYEAKLSDSAADLLAKVKAKFNADVAEIQQRAESYIPGSGEAPDPSDPVNKEPAPSVVAEDKKRTWLYVGLGCTVVGAAFLFFGRKRKHH